MMSEGSKAIKTCSIPSSSSRLSPLARPFTISNHFNRRESFDPLLGSAPSSTSTLDQPFPYLNLGDQSHRGYYAYQSDSTAITAFPFVNDLDFEFNSCFTSHPSEDPPVQTNFTPISSSLSKVGLESEIQGTSTNQQWLREVPRTNDQIATGVSLSCNNPPEQGSAIEGSKLVSKTPSVLHEKDCVVVGKDNRIRPVDEDKLHAGICVFRLANSEVNLLNKCMTKSFLISSDLPFSPRPQDNQSKLSYSVPLPTLSHCDSAIINNKICFPHLASCAPETLVSSEPKCISCSAQTFKPSGASYNATIVNPVPLENVPYGGTYTVSNMDSYSGNVVPGMFGSDIVRSPLDKVACQDLILTKKGEKIELVEPVHNETKIPCIMAKSKLQIACPTDHGDLSVEQHGVKAGIPDDKWSTNSDDSDVDSPCWKGTQVYKSSLRDSVPVNSEDCNGQSSSRESVCLKLEHSKNEKVARNSLNPLAPVFIPGNSKQKVDYHQKKCHGDGFSYIENVGALAVICSSREEGSRGSDKEGTCPSEEINDIGILWSSDVCDSREKYGTPYESFRNSAVNSCRLEPYIGEEYVSLESRLENFAGGMEGIADARYNVLDGVIDIAHTGKNSSILFPTTEIALNLHSTGVGVSSDLTERFQEPLKSTPPKLDANLLINTIQYLSELLLQNYSFALGSMSEHEYDKVLNIINKLYVVIGNQAGERAVRSGPCHMCTLHGKRQVADNHKVTRKDPKVVHSTEHEMPPEALFYRKLWLEAKTALYYQEHGLHMNRSQISADQNKGCVQAAVTDLKGSISASNQTEFNNLKKVKPPNLKLYVNQKS